MRSSSLASILSKIVLSGAGLACGSGTDTGVTDCPHTVIDKTATVTAQVTDICDAYQRLYPFPSGAAYGLGVADCKKLCNDATITDCHPPDVHIAYPVSDAGILTCDGPDTGTTATLTCQITHSEGVYTEGCPVAGRRTAGLDVAHSSAGGDTARRLGAHFALCTELEGISVHAFRRLARELRAFSAPKQLVRRAELAAGEEVVHTRVMSKLASKFGVQAACVQAPKLALRNLFEVALENAVEGCVRETFGAATALYQATHAKDADVRRAHARIADDERSHAELALDLATYFEGQLTAQQTARINDAKREAIAQLLREHEGNLAPELAYAAGLPPRNVARAMIAGLEAHVWNAQRAA